VLVTLDQRFEIGGHTLTHPRLSTLYRGGGRGSRSPWARKRSNRPLGHFNWTVFCYPRGATTQARNTSSQVRRRRIHRGADGSSASPRAAPDDLLQTPTTNATLTRHLVDGPVRGPDGRIPSLLAAAHPLLGVGIDWAIWPCFDQVLVDGGVFPPLGATVWEIDRNGDWDRLARVLDHLGGRGDVSYVTNGGARRCEGST